MKRKQQLQPKEIPTQQQSPYKLRKKVRAIKQREGAAVREEEKRRKREEGEKELIENLWKEFSLIIFM